MTSVYLKQGVVYKDVLVLRLDHVVSLGPQAGHVAVDVDGLLVLHPLQHRVDHDEGARPAHARAEGKNIHLRHCISNLGGRKVFGREFYFLFLSVCRDFCLHLRLFTITILKQAYIRDIIFTIFFNPSNVRVYIKCLHLYKI